MKKILLVALAAITLASCAKNEVVELNEGNAISFRAWTENAQRVTPTATGTILDFHVWGYVGTQAYFENILVSRPDADSAWDYTPHKFWPAEAIDFYAISPKSEATKVNAASTEVKVVDFAQPLVATSQIDLLYAVESDVTRPEPVAPVQLEFDHALSQISFQAKNVNVGGNASSLKVVIYGVKVANVNSVGTFTLPMDVDTSAADQAAADVTRALNWSALDTPATFTAGMAATAEIGTSVTVLTDVPGRLLLLPQTSVAYNPTDGNAAAQAGSYFLVECTVQDVDTELYLWGTVGTPKEVAIPFEANWEPGKHYIYTFQFGEGAGYNPEDGTTVLFPIDFTVLVDDFQAAPDAASPDAPVL